MTIDAMTGSRPWLTAGWTMLHFLWVGGALGLIAAAGRLALRRSSPEVRYGFALLVLGAMAVAPAAIAMTISGSADHRTDAAIPLAADATPLPHPSPGMPEPAVLPGPGVVSRAIPDRPRIQATPMGWLERAAAGLPWVWIAGTPITFALLAAGLAGADRLRRRSRLLPDGELAAMARDLARAIGVLRPVALGVCDRLAAPILIGVVRPMILLPSAAMTGWRPDQVEMALLHELAHVRRFDNLVNLWQRVVESLLFFHPAVWWVSGWIRLEREHCCDRLVVARTGRARPYAELLAGLALHGARPGRAAVAMAENPVVSRIRRILNPEDEVIPVSRPAFALAAAMLIAPAVLVAAAQPGAPATKKEATQQPDRARIEELIRRTRHGAEMFLGVQDRAYTLMQLAGLQARTGDREGARRTYREAEQLAETVGFDDSTYSPHILHWIVQAEARNDFRDEAIAAARKLTRIAETPIKNELRKMDLYSNLLRTQAGLGDRDGVQETLRAGRRFFTTSDDPAIKNGAPVSLVLLQAFSGDLAGALRMIHDPDLFKEPRPANSSDLRHNALSVLVGQIKAGACDREAARPVLEEALRVIAEEKEPLPWARMMKRNGWLQEIAEAQARLGMFDEALRSARMIETETIPGNLAPARQSEFLDEQRWRKAMALAEISLEQSKVGDVQGTWRSAREAARIVETFKGNRFTYPVWKVAEALARVGKLEAARQVADMLTPVGRIEVYEIIAATRRGAGDEAGARATLEAARDLAQKRLEDVKVGLLDPDGAEGKQGYALLEAVGRIRGELGDRKEAIATVRRINDGARRLEAMKRLAESLASAGDLEGALEAVDAMNSPKSQAEALKGVAASFSRREPAR